MNRYLKKTTLELYLQIVYDLYIMHALKLDL